MVVRRLIGYKVVLETRVEVHGGHAACAELTLDAIAISALAMSQFLGARSLMALFRAADHGPVLERR